MHDDKTLVCLARPAESHSNRILEKDSATGIGTVLPALKADRITAWSGCVAAKHSVRGCSGLEGEWEATFTRSHHVSIGLGRRPSSRKSIAEYEAVQERLDNVA